MTALYLRRRPTEWDQVLGQTSVVSSLIKKLGDNDLPNVILLHGPTGTGKTTIARILSAKLGVEPKENSPVYTERNCADCRSIDDVREIGADMGLAGFGKYSRRVWVLDEVVQLPKVTQQAMLKMLEDTPKHVYFFLCTSDKTGLLPTLIGRCYPVELKLLNVSTLLQLVQDVAEKEGNIITMTVAKKIANLADGSARMALQFLESVLTLEGESAQLATLEQTAAEALGYQIAQGLLYNKGWPVVEKLLRDLVQEPEAVRRVILAYCQKIILNEQDLKKKIRAFQIGNCFKIDYKESGLFGLLSSCWKVVNAK